MQSSNIPTSCCERCYPSNPRCSQRQSTATEGEKSIERENGWRSGRDSQVPVGGALSQHSAGAEPMLGPWELTSPAQCPRSGATCLQGQAHRSSQGAQLLRTGELGLSAVGRDNPEEWIYRSRSQSRDLPGFYRPPCLPCCVFLR